ncbi:MAG TPA: MerR family transcriptional regulator [Acidobacteriota bacterium]|jgi:DNA-binding transcriptional MerR regulator
MEQIPKKLYYKIGEVCDLCKVEPHVLRYWETEFPQLSPSKNNSGQRVYRYRDVQVVLRIKQLLYEEGYTIAGANKKLSGEKFDSRELELDDNTRAGPCDSMKTSQQATPESSPHPSKAAQSELSAASADVEPRRLLKEIRSQLKSVLEILK